MIWGGGENRDFFVFVQNVLFTVLAMKIVIHLRSILVISKYKGHSETFWDIRIRYAELRKNNSDNHISQMNMYFDSWS